MKTKEEVLKVANNFSAILEGLMRLEDLISFNLDSLENEKRLSMKSQDQPNKKGLELALKKVIFYQSYFKAGFCSFS